MTLSTSPIRNRFHRKTISNRFQERMWKIKAATSLLKSDMRRLNSGEFLSFLPSRKFIGSLVSRYRVKGNHPGWPVTWERLTSLYGLYRYAQPQRVWFFNKQ